MKILNRNEAKQRSVTVDKNHTLSSKSRVFSRINQRWSRNVGWFGWQVLVSRLHTAVSLHRCCWSAQVCRRCFLTPFSERETKSVLFCAYLKAIVVSSYAVGNRHERSCGSVSLFVTVFPLLKKLIHFKKRSTLVPCKWSMDSLDNVEKQQVNNSRLAQQTKLYISHFNAQH